MPTLFYKSLFNKSLFNKSFFKKNFFQKKGPVTATINTQAVTVDPKETLLQAALRQGIDFPYSCRVGGCATCKCKLVEGKVKELTETGYILSDEELDQGYILACQAVPLTDVRVQVDLNSQVQKRVVLGRVVAQQKLTHDITRLVMQLDESLSYKAGQFAEISIDSLRGVSRSYSFATAPQPNSRVTFFVRKVPGGVFSTLINDANVIGHQVKVEGPLGHFWLRAADVPLLLVAGGSGLAPILAILQEVVARQSTRPVTLLFGARAQRDLYALDEIKGIAAQWLAPFRFVPVLSEEAADSDWQGERGWVTEKIPVWVEAGAHAYLCGPPGMIDSAVSVLLDEGVAREHIHADRFTTQQDMASAVA